MQIIITKEHELFNYLRYAIAKEIEATGCNHTHEGFEKACTRVEKKFNISIDRKKTIEYMESEGGYCDCEILMNVMPVLQSKI